MIGYPLCTNTRGGSHMQPDHLGRRFSNLRVSLTSACNYACLYCVPDGRRLLRSPGELDAGSLLRLVALLRRVAGIERLRLTGGEPLIAPGLEAFLAGIGGMGFEEVTLTTNGQLLERRAGMLVDAGIRRINVSLDTLDPARFAKLARGGDLQAVLAGLDRARELGLQVKLNMVPMRGHNDDQVPVMLDYALAHGMELRFIELMRMGHLKEPGRFETLFYPMQEILDAIASHHEFRPAPTAGDATARRWEIPGRGYFGIIPNESAPFCTTCSRLRLTAQGHVYGCLSNTRRHRIADLLELPAAEAERLLGERLGMALADKQESAFSGVITVMRAIGG